MKSFTVRIPDRDHKILTALATLEGTTPAEKARELIATGLRSELDPATINALTDAARERDKAAAAELWQALDENTLEEATDE
jgi:hypothetical protein